MAVAEAAPPGTVDTLDLTASAVFGLRLVEHSRPQLPRTVRWQHVDARDLTRLWRTDAERVVDLRLPNGQPFLAVERDGDGRYLVRAPRFGRHIVAADGGAITSALPRIAAWRWQRLFLAQVLPLSAVLQGLDVFHASAVALGTDVVAFVGASGVGKTSTAAHLVAEGADFVTDDVLALEANENSVIAHAGPARLSIDPREIRRMAASGRVRLGEPIGSFEKRQFRTPPLAQPLPLSLLYFLQRAPGGDAVTFVDAPEPRRLLGAPFIRYVRSADRLTRHLDICARLASCARTFAVNAPPGVGAREVAARVHEHALDALASA
jgi:hypothetical protein